MIEAYEAAAAAVVVAAAAAGGFQNDVKSEDGRRKTEAPLC